MSEEWQNTPEIAAAKQALEAAREAEKAATEVTRAAHKALLEAMSAAHPVKVGTRLRSRRGQVAEVVGHEMSWNSLYVLGRYVLKGGNLGAFNKRLWDSDGWAPLP